MCTLTVVGRGAGIRLAVFPHLLSAWRLGLCLWRLFSELEQTLCLQFVLLSGLLQLLSLYLSLTSFLQLWDGWREGGREGGRVIASYAYFILLFQHEGRRRYIMLRCIRLPSVYKCAQIQYNILCMYWIHIRGQYHNFPDLLLHLLLSESIPLPLLSPFGLAIVHM